MNHKYIMGRLHTTRPDDHWQQMLEEIVRDVKIGRMDGPFMAPPCWGIKTIPAAQWPHTDTLKCGPAHHRPTSIAFAIEQVGSDDKMKIRRGENWQRSHHNKTIQTSDKPNVHRPDTFIAIARW